ncbi:trypco2 family protein [Streptomyces sp. NPDC008313]|uniref:trypco2 family protein n=1 Tax=Streptomyces sp. NPDC008313 TaxID=3364826 RepID=UPI0036E16F48
MTGDGTEDGIELADAVQAVRDQLLIAAGRATGQDLAFEVGDIQMEFTVELRSETKAGAKVRAWVLDAGVDATRSTGRTHKVSFTLTPKNARTGAPWSVGNPAAGGTARFGRASGH